MVELGRNCLATGQCVGTAQSMTNHSHSMTRKNTLYECHGDISNVKNISQSSVPSPKTSYCQVGGHYGIDYVTNYNVWHGWHFSRASGQLGFTKMAAKFIIGSFFVAFVTPQRCDQGDTVCTKLEKDDPIFQGQRCEVPSDCKGMDSYGAWNRFCVT